MNPNDKYICKAISTKDNTWVEGFVYVDRHGTYILTDGLKMISVHPDSMCRFTEKLDSEGKKVFEHDVIEFTDFDGVKCRAVVYFDKGQWMVKEKNYMPDDLYGYVLAYKVVGNTVGLLRGVGK